MACPHFTAALATLAPPRPSQQVHKDECTLCFDDPDTPDGIDVCLTCFNGACTGKTDRNHSALHYQKTQHPLVVNVKHTPKPKNNDQSDAAPKKLAILAESDADKFDYTTTPRCLTCHDGRHDAKASELPRTEKLQHLIDAIMSAMSSSQQSEVKAWEEEATPCHHTQNLIQPGDAHQLDLGSLASCGKCDLAFNLWLCLTCGHLGCGRAQFGGVGGNGHGLTHFQETGHPVSVKQGTITAEGTADIYCYACNDARIDPLLAHHLAHFGINVVDLSKTEKSMTELQLEQNLRFDFTMTGDDGKRLEPLYGPGNTGLRNLGNSCYMASVLQSLFALPAFRSRYGDSYRPHTLACTAANPSACFECQMGKMADGLLSGRYAVPRKADGDAPRPTASLGGQDDVAMADLASSTTATETAAGNSSGGNVGDDGAEPDANGPVFQAGIRPTMFKTLVGKGHEEFSTMRQQDADEFLKHLVEFIKKENRRLDTVAAPAAAPEAAAAAPTNDPTTVFAFALEQRLQCNRCRRVRYTVEAHDAGLSLPVPIRAKVKESAESSSKQLPAEGIHAPPAPSPAATATADAVEYEAVSLTECLDLFTAPEELEYHCPACDEKSTATKRTLFATFPEVLAVQVRRFQLVNWVPTKVNVPISVPLEAFELDRYLAKGPQEDDEILPEDIASAAGARGAASGGGEVTFDVGAMSQLTAMGFPEVRCKKALLATGNADAESAMTWLFAHMDDSDIDEPIDPSLLSVPTSVSTTSGGDTSMLEEMGFTRPQSLKALRLNGNNPELAVAWLFEHSDDVGDDPSTSTDTSNVSNEVLGSKTLPATYKLGSFISHKGPSVHSGHYVAHVRKEEGWVFYNDEKVVKAPLSAVVKKDGEEEEDVGVKGLRKLAYEYFFERV